MQVSDDVAADDVGAGAVARRRRSGEDGTQQDEGMSRVEVPCRRMDCSAGRRQA